MKRWKGKGRNKGRNWERKCLMEKEIFKPPDFTPSASHVAH